MSRNDPLRNFRYRVEIQGIAVAGFSEVMITESTTDVVEYREGTDEMHMLKLSGLNKFGNITLKRGVTYDDTALKLYQWHADVVAGKVRDVRKTVTIHVQDEKGEEKARFVVDNAWPIKYDPSDLSGKGNEVFIELFELANEGIKRMK